MQPLLFHDLPICLPDLSGARTVGKTITEETLANLEAENRMDICRLFSELGWTRLGGGCYCDAFLSPDGERVIKAGSGCGSRATLDAAEQSDNPHFPRIFARFDYETKFGDILFMAEVERLEPIDGDAFQEWKDAYNPATHCSYPNDPMGDAMRALEAAQEDYAEFGEPVRWDLHRANLMVRPSTGEIIINDPFADGD